MGVGWEVPDSVRPPTSGSSRTERRSAGVLNDITGLHGKLHLTAVADVRSAVKVGKQLLSKLISTVVSILCNRMLGSSRCKL